MAAAAVPLLPARHHRSSVSFLESGLTVETKVKPDSRKDTLDQTPRRQIRREIAFSPAQNLRLPSKRRQSPALPCSAAAFIFAAAGRQQFPVIESSVSLRRRGGAFDFLPMPRRRKDTSHHVRGGSTYVLFANRKPC